MRLVYQHASDISADLKRLKPEAPTLHRRWPVLVAGVFAVLVVAIAIFWFTKRQSSLLPELKVRQLTTNPTEGPVWSGAISPDGKYLAYTDRKGIHTQLVESGDTQTVPQPDALRDGQGRWLIVQWFPDSARFLANLFPRYSSDHERSVWIVSVLGGEPRKLRDDAAASSIAPDGSFFIFPATRTSSGSDHEVWLMGPKGELVRKVVETDENSSMLRGQWSLDGQRLVYSKFDKSGVTFESRDLKGGPPAKMLRIDGNVTDTGWLPDGRVLYSLDEPSLTDHTCNYWEIQLVLTANLYGPPGCARSPSTLCAIAERSQDLKQLIFTAFGPLQGRGGELTRFDIDPQGNYDWALSPDGTRIAVLNMLKGRIHMHD